MNRTSLAGFVLVACSGIAALGTSTSARADDATMTKCIATNDQALDLQKKGRLLDARRLLAQCAAPSCGAEMSEACAQEIAEVNARIPAVVFLPKNGAGEDVAGVKLFVDGTLYAERLDGSAVVIDPGEHEFRFEVAGQEPVTKRFVLHERENSRRETILIGPPAPALPPALRPSGDGQVTLTVVGNPPSPHQLDSTGSFQRTMGTLVLAIALPVAIITGSTFGLLAATKWSSATSECKPSCAPGSQGPSDVSSARSAAFGADVAFGVAGAALVGGIVLRVTAPARRLVGSPAPEVHVTPAISDRGGSVLLGGSFQ